MAKEKLPTHATFLVWLVIKQVEKDVLLVSKLEVSKIPHLVDVTLDTLKSMDKEFVKNATIPVLFVLEPLIKIVLMKVEKDAQKEEHLSEEDVNWNLDISINPQWVKEENATILVKIVLDLTLKTVLHVGNHWTEEKILQKET